MLQKMLGGRYTKISHKGTHWSPLNVVLHASVTSDYPKMERVFHIRLDLKVGSNEKRGGSGLGKETIIDLRTGTVAIEGYLQFERVVSM
jgi:hypothetical protein